MKLCVFDFDSTLMDGETIDILASELSLEDEISAITKKAMDGDIDFFESLIKRVELLKGLSEARVDEICHSLPYMNGAKESVSELKKMGYKVVCFSGGFIRATSYAKKILGFDADFANELHIKDGILTGLVGGAMMHYNSKGYMLSNLQDMMGISKIDTLVIGDGANDLSMFAYAEKRIAFCANEILKKDANIIINKKDLTLILEHV